MFAQPVNPFFYRVTGCHSHRPASCSVWQQVQNALTMTKLRARDVEPSQRIGVMRSWMTMSRDDLEIGTVMEIGGILGGGRGIEGGMMKGIGEGGVE